MGCESDYRRFRKYHKNYIKKGAREKFIKYFTKRFMQTTNNTAQWQKINSIDQGLVPDRVGDLIADLMRQVFDQVVNNCKSRYSKKYNKHLQEVTNDLVKAITNVSPQQAMKKVNDTLVPQQLDEETALTKERFNKFVNEVREKEPLSKVKFKPEHVKRIINIMIAILATSLGCDVDIIRPSILNLLDNTMQSDQAEQIIIKYGKEISKLCSKDKHPADISSLKKLLFFIKKIFPRSSGFSDTSIQDIIANAKESPTKLQQFYDQYRTLLYNLVLQSSVDILHPTFVSSIRGMWASLEASIFRDKTLPVLNDGNIEKYLQELLALLKAAKQSLLDFTKTTCQDKPGIIYGKKTDLKDNKNCPKVFKDAKQLDEIIAQVDQHIIDHNFEKFKKKINKLTHTKVLKTIEDLVRNNPNYTVLASMIKLPTDTDDGETDNEDDSEDDLDQGSEETKGAS